MNQHHKPCAECPFRRDIKPGELGGSPVETYIGQSVLPFWLPCHCDKNYAYKESKVGEVSQCVGTAIFRSNIGVAQLMPASLLNLPSDKTVVFGSMVEFVAHHKRISNGEAVAFLAGGTMRRCIEKEANDPMMKILERNGKKV
jgi:hypothetical protein